MPRISPGSGAHQRRADLPCFTCGNAVAELRRDLPLRYSSPEMATLCGRCWAQFGGQAGAAEIGAAPTAAVPVRAAEGPTEWAKLLMAVPWLQGLRRDARRRLQVLVETLRNWADWSTGEAWPTWARLQAATGWGRSSVARWLRQLWILGWIDRIEPGSTPQFRPMASPIEGNRAAVYGLLVPAYAEHIEPQERLHRYRMTIAEMRDKIAQLKAAEEKTWTPSCSFDLLELKIVVGHLRTRAREIFHRSTAVSEVDEQTIEPLRGRIDEGQGQFATKVPTTRAQMLAAAAELRRQHPVLARLSVRAIRSICRSWWRSDWCNRDVLHALRYRPTGWSGTESGHVEYAVIHPAGWVRSRLSTWRDERGRPLPTRHTRRLTKFVDELDQQVSREAFGVIGARLQDEHGFLTPQVIADHGRRCGDQLAAERRTEATRVAVVAERRVADAARRAKATTAPALRTPLQDKLIAQAHATIPAPSPSAASEPVDEFAGLDPVERRRRIHERARIYAALNRRNRR